MLDEKLKKFSKQLSERSQEALSQLKQIYWEGTEHWDELLEERAENSGNLVLSEYTKKIINDFKKGSKK